MDNFKFKQIIKTPFQKSLEREYINYIILMIYLNKWIKNQLIQPHQQVFDLINLIEKNKQKLNQKIKTKKIKTKDENFLKENNFLENKLFVFLNNNNITLNNKISEILEKLEKKLIKFKK